MCEEIEKILKNKKDGSKREIMEPDNELKKIQTRIFELLNRIEKPNWLMSGKRYTSYVDNARKHQDNSFVTTMDIEKFYDSTQEVQVYNFFKQRLETSIDVACIITYLLTFEGKIPTGTSCSQLIAYLAYEEVFQKINSLCEENCLEFTLWVDDMTISSNGIIDKSVISSINNILVSRALRIKKSKTIMWSSKRNKTITGVIVRKDGTLSVPNEKRKPILDLFIKCKNEKEIHPKNLLKLKGMLTSARQIESNIFPEVDQYLKSKNEIIKKYNRECNNRTKLSKSKCRKNELVNLG